jgi:hypothetical protein
MQAMSDQAAGAFQEISIFIAERVQVIALYVQHSKNMPVLIPHRNNDLGARRMKRGQVSRVFVHIAHDERLT